MRSSSEADREQINKEAGMKHRRHSNNKGLRQARRGHTQSQVKRIARRLRIPFADSSTSKPETNPSGNGVAANKAQIEDLINTVTPVHIKKCDTKSHQLPLTPAFRAFTA